MQAIFEIVAIVGPGLVGGSLGMAIRRRGLARHVVGIGHRQSSLRTALDVGAVDATALDVSQGVRSADLVVLATPIDAIPKLIGRVSASMKSGAVLTDVASTKQQVIKALTAGLRDRPDVACVPTHPMAGRERRGAENADALLFEGSVCIVTPLPDTPRDALDRVQALWEAVGATVHEMDPAAHDRLVARISHLPHLAVAALLQTVAADEAAFAGGGLIDTTRIASGNPALWRTICETNAEAVAAALGSYAESLQQIQGLIREGRFDELVELLRRAKDKRDALLALRRANTQKGERR